MVGGALSGARSLARSMHGEDGTDLASGSSSAWSLHPLCPWLTSCIPFVLGMALAWSLVLGMALATHAHWVKAGCTAMRCSAVPQPFTIMPQIRNVRVSPCFVGLNHKTPKFTPFSYCSQVRKAPQTQNNYLHSTAPLTTMYLHQRHNAAGHTTTHRGTQPWHAKHNPKPKKPPLAKAPHLW